MSASFPTLLHYIGLDSLPGLLDWNASIYSSHYRVAFSFLTYVPFSVFFFLFLVGDRLSSGEDETGIAYVTYYTLMYWGRSLGAKMTVYYIYGLFFHYGGLR